MKCKKHINKSDYSCTDCIHEIMYDLDEELRSNEKLARQMCNKEFD